MYCVLCTCTLLRGIRTPLMLYLKENPKCLVVIWKGIEEKSPCGDNSSGEKQGFSHFAEFSSLPVLTMEQEIKVESPPLVIN